MASIHLQGVVKRFGDTAAVNQVTFDIHAGELFFLLGPSGCGKTTLLRILAGFVRPDSGDVFFGDKCVTHFPPRARDAGMVFQTYALWPHMTVAGNIAFGLRVRRLSRLKIADRVEQILKLVRMQGLGNRLPSQLSGGQQQRVALARALVIEPHVLLLDEPLSNLDARLRDEMRGEIDRLHKETHLTMVYVTHDQKEALSLADRIGVMESGQLVQVGTPQELYDRPANRFVASFLGDSNFLPGKIRHRDATGCTVDTAVGTLLAAAGRPAGQSGRTEPGDAVVCSIRPDALSLSEEAANGANSVNCIPATVERVEFLGQLCHVRLRAAGNTELLAVSLPRIAGRLRTGDKVTLTAAPDQVIIL
jgi:iron(III) transport system ATP-binding protein